MSRGSEHKYLFEKWSQDTLGGKWEEKSYKGVIKQIATVGNHPLMLQRNSGKLWENCILFFSTQRLGTGL